MRERFSVDWDKILDVISQPTPRYTATELFLIRYAFQALVHSIWRERNASRHGEEPREDRVLAKLVDKLIRLKLLAVKGKGKKYLEESLGVWFGSRI